MIEASFERHRRELRIHCYRMTGSYVEAEDLVQETFLRAWRRRETLQSPAGLRAWLYKIATNACLDALKAADRRPAVVESPRDVPWLTPFPDHLLAPAEDEPDALVVARETIELTFLAVIQVLPPRQRAALILRDVLEWSAADTAALLELSVPAVNSALQRARSTLREHLPAPGREDWRSPAVSARERELLDGFIDTHQRGDTEGALALLADDIRVTMPPEPMVIDGLEMLAGLQQQAFAPPFMAWRLVPIAANRMPAAASYARLEGSDEFVAFKIDVLRAAGGRIAEITTFGPELFAAFGLPATH